jgi:hypothetical protein
MPLLDSAMTGKGSGISSRASSVCGDSTIPPSWGSGNIPLTLLRGVAVTLLHFLAAGEGLSQQHPDIPLSTSGPYCPPSHSPLLTVLELLQFN